MTNLNYAVLDAKLVELDGMYIILQYEGGTDMIEEILNLEQEIRDSGHENELDDFGIGMDTVVRLAGELHDLYEEMDEGDDEYGLCAHDAAVIDQFLRVKGYADRADAAKR